MVGLSVENNDATEAPAIITRVWGQASSEDPSVPGPWVVNVTAFPDSSPPMPMTSISIHESEASARGAHPSSAGFWPSHDTPEEGVAAPAADTPEGGVVAPVA